MKVSVIMPTIRVEWIRESLKSFVEQDYDCELIVVNDGAEHDYESILKEFNCNRIKYYKIDRVSIGEANNFGISKATGELICTLHDDDRFAPDSLKCRAEALKDYDVVWGASKKMSLQGVIGDVEPSYPPDKNRIWKQDYINWTTIMWRKSVHDKIGLFGSMSYNEDWHFEMRFINECKCKNIDDIVMYYRLHSGQYSAIGRQAGKTGIEERKMREEFGGKYGYC